MALVDTSIVNPAAFQLTPQTGDITQRLLGVLQQKRQETQRQDIAQANKLKEDFKLVGDQMLRVRGISEYTSQRKEMARLAQDSIKRGEDPTVFTDALNIDNPDELNLYLTRVATQAGNVKEVIDQRTKEAEEATKKEASDAVSPVQSSSILDTGDVQIVRKDGTTEIVSPGEAQKTLVREAKLFGAELQGLRSGERRAAVESIKVATDAFKRLEPIDKNIANLNEGIRLVDEGASTGVITKLFPSFRDATKRLDNLQKQLGLDVLRNTTFGALSEKELSFALSTAIPLGLEGESLKKWMADKRDAQIKLSNYLRESAIFLGTPGNTVADFLRLKGDRQSERAAPEIPAAVAPEEAAPVTAPKRLRFNPETGLLE